MIVSPACHCLIPVQDVLLVQVDALFLPKVTFFPQEPKSSAILPDSLGGLILSFPTTHQKPVRGSPACCKRLQYWLKVDILFAICSTYDSAGIFALMN
jgi:hypothetical protein